MASRWRFRRESARARLSSTSTPSGRDSSRASAAGGLPARKLRLREEDLAAPRLRLGLGLRGPGILRAVDVELLFTLLPPPAAHEEPAQGVAGRGQVRRQLEGLAVGRLGLVETARGLLGTPQLEADGGVLRREGRGPVELATRGLGLALRQVEPAEVEAQRRGVRMLARRVLERGASLFDAPGRRARSPARRASPRPGRPARVPGRARPPRRRNAAARRAPSRRRRAAPRRSGTSPLPRPPPRCRVRSVRRSRGTRRAPAGAAPARLERDQPLVGRDRPVVPGGPVGLGQTVERPDRVGRERRGPGELARRVEGAPRGAQRQPVDVAGLRALGSEGGRQAALVDGVAHLALRHQGEREVPVGPRVAGLRAENLPQEGLGPGVVLALHQFLGARQLVRGRVGGGGHGLQPSGDQREGQTERGDAPHWADSIRGTGCGDGIRRRDEARYGELSEARAGSLAPTRLGMTREERGSPRVTS